MDRALERAGWWTITTALAYVVYWLITHPRWVAVQPAGIGQPLRGHGDAGEIAAR